MALLTIRYSWWNYHRCRVGGVTPVHLWAGKCRERFCRADCDQGDKTGQFSSYAFRSCSLLVGGVHASAVVVDEISNAWQVLAYQYALAVDDTPQEPATPLPVLDVVQPALELATAARPVDSETVVPSSRDPPRLQNVDGQMTAWLPFSDEPSQTWAASGCPHCDCPAHRPARSGRCRVHATRCC